MPTRHPSGRCFSFTLPRCRRPGPFPSARGPRGSPVPVLGQPNPLAHPAASAPGTQQTGTMGHPQATQPLNSRQHPINNFCAKATATAVCHGGAAGESKSGRDLASGLGPGSRRCLRGGYNPAKTSPRWRSFRCIQCFCLYGGRALFPSCPTGAWSWPTPVETIQLAQSSDICAGSSWASSGLEAI